MNNIREIQKLNDLELERGLVDKASWHDQFKGSAYIHVGGLSFDLSEGDILSIFSQFGEIVDLDLVRDKITGKPKGFCFIGYEDQRSTVLTVDNLNGVEILGRIIKVDHTLNYEGRRPGKNEDEQEFAEKERERKLAVLPPHLRPDRVDSAETSSDEEEEEDDQEDRRKKDSSTMPPLDKNDPMSAYFYQKNLDKEKRRSEKAEKKAAKKEKKEKRKLDNSNDDEVVRRERRRRSRSRSRPRTRDRIY